MKDIVERLRDWRWADEAEHQVVDKDVADQAADEIERLQADAARRRYVRDALCLHKIEENIDRLIEEAKGEGK